MIGVEHPQAELVRTTATARGRTASIAASAATSQSPAASTSAARMINVAMAMIAPSRVDRT